jgi:predicted restriction endonuclease
MEQIMINKYNGFVYKKNVDWSVLHQGLSIPVTIQQKFSSEANKYVPRGNSKKIKIILNGKIYYAQLKNQPINIQKFGNRKDILQIRYNPTNELAVNLRAIFSKSFTYISGQRQLNKDSGINSHIKVPNSINETIAIYLTEDPDTYIFECLTHSDYLVIEDEIICETEAIYESSINYNLTDINSRIDEKSQLLKIRRLNRAIGDCLKELYNYRCQICGENIGGKYDANIVEAHHIIPFVESLNNDANNIMVLCPNHHRIIHKVTPEFDRKKLAYRYENGLQEKILINNHLC